MTRKMRDLGDPIQGPDEPAYFEAAPATDRPPLDLDAIRARADAATPGPWAWEATGEKDNSWGLGVVVDLDGESLSGDVTDHEGTEVVEPVCYQDDGHLPDAEFIAHAREDVPALLAEVTALRAELDAGALTKASLEGVLADLQADCIRLRTEVDDVRLQLGQAVDAAARAERDEPATGEDVEVVARALNNAGWTCDGGTHEPGLYDECADCRHWCDEGAQVALAALDLSGREQALREAERERDRLSLAYAALQEEKRLVVKDWGAMRAELDAARAVIKKLEDQLIPDGA